MSWRDSITEEPISEQDSQSIKKSWRDSIVEEPETSFRQNVKDVGMSIGQGATLGFGDELLAAIKAAEEVATDEPEISDFAKLYREYQKQNEAAYEEAKARSPGLTFAGELGGGLIPAALTMGASEVPTLGRAMMSGAKFGGLAGLGGSKGTTEEAISDIKQGKIPEMAKDVAFSGAIGAAAPIAFNAASGAKNLLAKQIEDSPLATQVIQSFKEGTKGKGFTGRQALERMQKEASDVATNIEGKINKGREFIQNQYKDVLSGKNVDINPDQANAFSTVENILKATGKRQGLYGEDEIEGAISEFGKSLLSIKKLKEGKISAQELKDLQKYLRSSAYSSNQTIEVATELDKAQKFANDLLKNKVPGYSEVNSQFRDFENAIETALSSVPTESRTIGSIKSKGDTPLFKMGKDIVEKSELPYGLGEKQFEKLSLIRDELKKLKSSNPKILENMGIDNIDDFIKNIRTESDIQAVGHVIRKAGQLQQQVDLLGYTRGGLYFGANILGRPAGAISSVAKKIKLPELSRMLYQASDNELSGVANTLNNSGYSHLGNALNDAIKNKSLTTRNAVLFSIMQNPKIRRDLFGDQGNENE